ncbi:MAG: cation transporter [Bacteroidetes bacterium]|nr:cation transporter [Bacteroidota bacterium]
MIGSSKGKVSVMKLMLFFSLILLSVKFVAWWITRSNAVLTDALESIVNVVAGSFALFSIVYASRPRDKEHPYGHGKIEFVSAGFEGALILLAGTAILVQATYGFFYPHAIPRADLGGMLIAVSGVCNFIMGKYLMLRGRNENSEAMRASGKHLVTDMFTSTGIFAGLIVIHLTGWNWLDNALAIFFGIIIFFTGYRIVRRSFGNLLDEQDEVKIGELIRILNENRRDPWIDMHNLRVLKYGSGLHVDAHMTLPWYFSLEKAHDEVDAVDKLVRKQIGEELEFFIHSDPCLPECCPICNLKNCAERKFPQEKKIIWSKENMLPDKKHTLKS